MRIEGYVEAEAALFAEGVLEQGLREYLESDNPALIFYGRPAERLGTVTKISGRGDRILVSATLPQPPPNTPLADAFRKIAAGTIKSLAVIGDFTRDRAEVFAFSIAPLTPQPGTGLLTKVTR